MDIEELQRRLGEAESRVLEKQRRCEEVESSAGMVRDSERNAGANHKLSYMLTDGDARALSGAIYLYSLTTVGLYGWTLCYFESKQRADNF